MEKALQDKPVEGFPVPPGIIFIRVDHKTGLPTQSAGPGTISECFLENAPPGENEPDIMEGKEELFR